jgi:3-dehydroquinate dehydratase II
MHTYAISRVTDRRHRIALIDGPNMSNLGKRNARVYGPIASIDALHEFVVDAGHGLGVDVETFVSNYEGAILEYIHESADRVDGYLINPAGLMAHGIAVPHALTETGKPSLELHFANTHASAGNLRAPSIGPVESRFTPLMTGMVMGLRHYGYVAGLVGLVLALDDDAFLGAGAQ